MRNDAEDFAQRMYGRVPANYRVYDAERGQPLLALFRVVGEQVSNLRQDMDALWDNYFIETCEDWVVPYIGTLAGANLLAQPVGQSNRLDVRNTVMWRRTKGTPRMLEQLSKAISEWPTGLAEFFKVLGWAQNLNHLRMDAPLTPDLRDWYLLSRLGGPTDGIAHAASFQTVRSLDGARVTSPTLGVGRAAFATPGRFQIKNVGFFVRRLETFPVRGATPFAISPSCFTFDPLARNVPLFVEKSGQALTRAEFAHAPTDTFGKDVAVRQHGVLLASDAAAEAGVSRSVTPFTFGGAGAALALQDMRILEPAFGQGALRFVIAAEWIESGGTVVLGTVNTASGFSAGGASGGTGRLAMRVRLAAGSPPARFPGAVVAVRAARPGPVRTEDALYVYLPARFLGFGDDAAFLVADDGSTYTGTPLGLATLARAGEGQVYPQRVTAPSTAPLDGFVELNRGPDGVRFADPSRFAGAGAEAQVELFTGVFQALGSIATIAQGTVPAFTYTPSPAAVSGNLPSQGLLSVRWRALAGTYLPPAELIVVNRRGRSVLVYLPQVTNVPAEGVRLFVAEDGSTYLAPAGIQEAPAVFPQSSLRRAASGQVLAIPGVWPIQHRRAVAMNLCRCERQSLLNAGELGVDPELGGFAFATGDPVIGQGGVTVDYVEAFSDRVGALTYDRPMDAAATRIVAQSGDWPGGRPVHTTVASALAAASNGDVIEIADSGTYRSAVPLDLNNAAIHNLTLRAGPGQRPVLVGPGIRVRVPMDSLVISGVFLSGGPLTVERRVAHLRLEASTLAPDAALPAMLISTASDLNDRAYYLLCRCVTGGVQVAAGVGQLTIADSIVDQRGGLAIGAVEPDAARSVQLERVTVLGEIHAEVFNASECLLEELAVAEDRQAGCVRFTRFERGSLLPRRFQCVPAEADPRVLAPMFHSRQFGRPDYVQLAAACPQEILRASESGAEVGAFASRLNGIRLGNLETKLREFLPVGLNAVVIAET